MRLVPQNVRTRLTLWYVAILAAVLLVYGGLTSTALLVQLRSQLDSLAIEDLETVEGFLTLSPDGQVLLRSDYHDHEYPDASSRRYLEVRDSDGTVLFRNQRLGNDLLGGMPAAGEGLNTYSPRSIQLPNGTRVRVVSRQHMVQGHPTLIRVGFSEEELWQRFWEVAVGLIAGLPLCLGLAGFGGYFLARRALAPVDRMATRAEEIHADRLSERIKIDNPNDELGRLGQAFNRTLARLERSFENMRQFTADASHELRTPLTAIRSVGEVGLQTDGDKEYYREVIGSMLEESARLNRLVSSLLTISRADAGQIPLDRKPLELLPFVRETCARLEILADERRQSLSVTGDSGVWVQADPTILRQVMVNLLDNAIKYSPEGGKICVHVASRNGAGAVIEFQDEGPGISPEHRDRIFDRFYRIDEARSRETGGAGLGLAIAKWGAEIHGGRLNLADTQGVGSVFRVSLS